MDDQPPEEAVAGDSLAEGGMPFGRYRLIELLGRGGMGEVWRAFDTATERIVALKVLPEYLFKDKKFQERFRREAHAAARLNSPHVIPIHFYGEIDGKLFVDMRLIEGRDLQTVLIHGPLEPGRTVRIIEQVAKALHAAHKVGLVHRDVKPSNILLDEEDYAYLIDFGIARAAGETDLTGTGSVIGSFRYMAPERFSDKEADARADVYALACVLFECLTGHAPYPGDSIEQQYAGHVATPAPRPSSTNPNLPAALDRVTDKGLAKDPDQRYATTVELARAARDATTFEDETQAAEIATMQAETPGHGEAAGHADAGTAGEEIQDAEKTIEAGAFAATTKDTAMRTRRPAGRRIAIAVAIAAVLFVGSAAFAGATLQPYLSDRAVVATKLKVARTAANAITALWTYTPENMDTLADRASMYLSGDFAAQYRKFVDAIVGPNKQAKVTNHTEVTGVAVESLAGPNASNAIAIVYTNTTSTSPLTNNVPTLKYLSYRLIMKRDNGRWLVTRMTTITSLDLTPHL